MKYALLLACFGSFYALAASNAETIGAQAFMQSEVKRLQGLLSNGTGTSAQATNFLNQSRDLFDFQELGRRTIKEHLAKAKPAEQKEFLEKFQELIELSYRSKTEKYVKDYPLTFLGEEAQSGDVKVKLKAKTEKHELDIALFLYKTQSAKDAWKIFNVSYDTVNLQEIYRKQFGRIIVQKSFAELLRRIDVKIAALKKKKK